MVLRRDLPKRRRNSSSLPNRRIVTDGFLQRPTWESETELLSRNIDDHVLHEAGKAVHIRAVGIVGDAIALVEHDAFAGAIDERRAAEQQDQEYGILLLGAHKCRRALNDVLFGNDVGQPDVAQINVLVASLKTILLQARAI